MDASFPNSIIVAVSSDNVTVDKEKGIMLVRRKPDVVTIIDGQHRLAGFMDNKTNGFYLIVTVFLDLELEEQAYIFATINTKHTRINPSLAKDLLDFSRSETPDKLAHNIAKKFNTEKDSPWYRQIKMLGRKDELSTGLITQHSFTKEIINLIYDSKYEPQVRDVLMKHSNNRSKLSQFDDKFGRFPLWDIYKRSEDGVIYGLLFNYFLAVRDAFPIEWNNANYILTKTTGYGAIMRGLWVLIPNLLQQRDVSKEPFDRIASKCRERLGISGKKLINADFPAGTKGKNALYGIMFEQ